MFIKRSIESRVTQLAKQYPVLTITGPRQSGKTTLCKQLFPDKPYVSLEDLETRRFAQDDPRQFLSRYPEGAIFDEIQRVPDLFSYIQTIVDSQNKPGQFVLTGSQQFEMMAKVTQSLAGRTAIIKLLPFSYAEAYSAKEKPSREDVLYKGFYPRIFHDKLLPTDYYSFYTTTYIERDLRQLIQIQNLSTFEIFLKLCAGRTGQLLNMANLANECGIDQKTVKAWLAVLEASYIIKRLFPYYKSQNRRLVKMPKLVFLDTGLACYLLGIQKPEQLVGHPLFGNLFETYVLGELWKQKANQVVMDNLYFYRDHIGHEMDVIIDHGLNLDQLEIKSAQTIQSGLFEGFQWLADQKYDIRKSILVYGGDETYVRNNIQIVSWRELLRVEEK